MASPQPRRPWWQPSYSRHGRIGVGCTMAAMSEATPPTSTADADPLESGRTALARHAWLEAFEQLSLADQGGQLSGADLESLSLAAFFAARADASLDVKERAFKAYLAEGNDLRAAYLAIDVARTYGYRARSRSPRHGAAVPRGSSVRTATPTPTGTWHSGGVRAPLRRAMSTPHSPSRNSPSRSGPAQPTPTSRRAH